MLTIFCLPKTFRGHIATIQHNAFSSWTRLEPRPEILVLGNDEGCAEAAKEFGARHVPEIERSESGTPLMSSIFEVGQRAATHDLVCYVNADIMLLSDFIQAVRLVSGARKQFLLAGQRFDLDVSGKFDFESPSWEAQLRALVAQHGKLFGPYGIDYFVFRRGLINRMPPFAVGRPDWDNWLLYEACRRGARLIDATGAITAVHQNHQSDAERIHVWSSPEAKRNIQLAGSHSFTLDRAEFVVRDGRLVKLELPSGKRLSMMALRHPWLRLPIWLVRQLAKLTRSIRGGSCAGDHKSPH